MKNMQSYGKMTGFRVRCKINLIHEMWIDKKPSLAV
jgi:phage terminase large subunit-like protein